MKKDHFKQKLLLSPGKGPAFVTWMAIIRVTELAHFNILRCRKTIDYTFI